jgi:hypothetical protein
MIHVIGLMVGFYLLARSVELFHRNPSRVVRVFAAMAGLVAALGIVLLIAMALMGAPVAESQIYFGPRPF